MITLRAFRERDYVLVNLFIFIQFCFFQKDCYEVYALVPGLLREEVSKCKSFIMVGYCPSIMIFSMCCKSWSR
jgi:hypothetical protein